MRIDMNSSCSKCTSVPFCKDPLASKSAAQKYRSDALMHAEDPLKAWPHIAKPIANDFKDTGLLCVAVYLSVLTEPFLACPKL